MRRLLLLPFAAFLLPGPAAGQELRSGPGAPAASSQIPPTRMPGDRSGATPAPAPTTSGAPGTQSTDHIRAVPPRPGLAPDHAEVPGAERRPPADHQVLGGPPVPGAMRPEHSGGFLPRPDAIPPHIGDLVRPDAPTTGTGR
jgi:hypothetical protein